MPLESSNRYQGNLAALSAFQPDVAAVVDATPVPDVVTPATGRDGTDTFLIASDGGRQAWLGGSSAPSISAPEMLAAFASDGGNASLPGVLTGLEPLVLLSRMPGHCALFVVEEDPLNIKLAMCLRDYADLITAGRLIFLFGNTLVEGLQTLFKAHPGYTMPTQLVKIPHRSAAQITDLKRRLESAGEALAGVVARSIDSHAQALAARTFGPLPDAPRVAAVGTDARPLSLEEARRIDRALAKLQWPYELCVPDAPAKCHRVARLRAIERVSADLVLVVNAGVGQLQPLLPPELPVALWYLPGATVDASVGRTLQPNHFAFASSRTMQKRLEGAGVESGLIEHCDVAADDTAYRPITLTPGELDTSATDVTVLMDLPDDRPEVSNVTLDSHVALWRALQAGALQAADRCGDDDIAGELVDEAQRASGTTLHEASVRDHFVALLKTRILPVGIARAAVDALSAEGYRVAAWGAHWPRLYKDADVGRGAIPVADELNRIFNATSIIAFPEPSPWAAQTALDALAAGSAAILRGSAESFFHEQPGLTSLGPHLRFYRTRQELLKIVRLLRSHADRQPDRAEAARSAVLAEHTIAHRLRTIAARVRQRQPSPARVD